ncbi:MAG: HAMP domain-containing sensor histidine kinase [Romboutsia sp.]
MINKNVFTKTKESLIKINIVVVGSFLIIFSIFIFLYFKGLTYNSIDKKLEEELEYITNQLSSSSYFAPVTKDPRNLVYIYEYGRIKYYKPNSYFEGVLPDKNENKKDIFFSYSDKGYTFRELNVALDKYRMQIIRNIDSEISSLRQLIFVFIIGIFISILITYFVAIYLTKKALIPIETAWSNQEKFIQDASHELRTPISIVSSKLEIMLKSPNNTIGDEVETIADAMKETRRIKKMISDLLSLTKEDSITKVNLEKVNIVNIIDEISSDYGDIAQMQDKVFNVSYNIIDEVMDTDKNKIIQLIRIFIDNAFKYTKEGDNISIILSQKDNYIIILIKDSGIGIKKEEIAFVFDRFFRSENVRNKDIDGSGIGLSIANMLIVNLKGKIEVNSTINIGTEFEISIPRTRQST